MVLHENFLRSRDLRSRRSAANDIRHTYKAHMVTWIPDSGRGD